ncbi:FecR family protein [Chitinophaga skermanii]|uniref:FecR family protein n=1 Tax=Chitinophaga skermanii TaxID=331697 RepID=A0A327QXE3_9BACT|nr:FecR family protein [Chitinophaga skermanii]RAJ08468.1 FecR family protein [Chitinophaga skermanii]
MEDQSFRIGLLIHKYWANELNDVEKAELDAWLAIDPANAAFLAQLGDPTLMATAVDQFSRYDEKASWSKIHAAFPASKQPIVQPLRKYIYWAAAAMVTGLVGYYALKIQTTSPSKPTIIASSHLDKAPGSNKATLTLSNGKTVNLDDISNGELQESDGSRLHKQNNGGIAYAGNEDVVVQHTLSTPRGGQYCLQLPDGTRVWLNAASSITYPTAFNGKERRVKISGEAYFEVTQEANKPFIAQLNSGQQIEVLGTQFNINAYADEPTIKATLVQGSVRVRNQHGSQLLLPRQQAVFTASSNISLQQLADVESVIAWKEGKFQLDGIDLASFMRQIGRWYNVDVRFANTPSDRKLFGGTINRDVQLSTVLKALSLYGINTKLEHNVLIVE